MVRTNGNNVLVNGRFVTQRRTGVQRYAFEITRRLLGSIQLVAPRTVAPEYEPFSSITIVDPIGSFARGGSLAHLWEQVALPRWLRKGGLLWSPCGSGPLVVQNQVVTMHDVAHLEHPEWFNRRFASWYRFLIPRLVQRVRQVITVSEFTKARLLATTRVPPEKIIVVSNGVDSCFQPKPQEEVDRVREVLGIPSPDYVVTLGSLEPRKNLRRLFAAWEILRRRIPGVELVVGGSGAKVFRNTGFDRPPAGVRLVGHVSERDLPALYSGALLFAYVSLYEGFGLPPLGSHGVWNSSCYL